MQNINDKTLTGGALLFVGAIVLALLLQWWLAPSYDIDNQALLGQASRGELLLKPWQIDELRRQEGLKDATLVLVNGAELDDQGVFGIKIQYELNQLLTDEVIKQIRKSSTIFIVAPDESIAIASAWFLRAKGLNQAFAIAGDPKFVQNNILENYQPKFAQTSAEKAKYNFSKFFGSSQDKSKINSSFTLPTGAPTVKKATGGC